MSIIVNGTTVSVIHIRHDGRSHEIYPEDINNIGLDITAGQLLSSLENHLDLSVGELSGYEVDLDARASENAIVRPQAKFG